MSHDVFISHSSKDKPIANAVCATLEARGIRCWIAPRDILPGTDYGEAIVEAITQSRFMILILSTDANQSRQIVREVERAVNKNVIIIPFRIEEVALSKSLEFFLSTPHWLDALTPPLEEHIEYLAETVLLLKGQKTLADTSVSAATPSQSITASSPTLVETSKPTTAVLLNSEQGDSDLTFKTLAREPEKLVNQRLGSYVLRQLIGKGGSGIVYRALNPKLGQENCIKVFYPLRPDVANVARIIERGVRGVAALNHPNIVRVFDFATFELSDTSSFYLVMELVHGAPLLDWFEGRTTNETLFMALAIAKALRAAHQCTYFDEVGFEQHGLLHGDIKPENIMVRPDNSPVLLDFMMVDVQRLLDRSIVPFPDLDTSTMAFGTPNYMAPEQEEQGIVTVKTDIFSLGKTFQELLGRAPEDVRQLLRRMTEEEPSERPQDLSEVVDALQALSLNPPANPEPAKDPSHGESTNVTDRTTQTLRLPHSGDTLFARSADDVVPTQTFSAPASAITGALPSEYAAKPDTPLYLDENVQFTVYRPRAIVPQKWYSLLAFAHLSEKREDASDDEPDPLEEVRTQAQRLLGEQANDYQNLTQDTRQAIPREGEITFVPEMPGVEFNPPRRSFTWEESVHREDFRLRAAVDIDGRVVKGSLSVFLGCILLADIPLSIRVDSQQASTQPRLPLEETHARPYRKIFASYSHQDRDVVEQFERFVEALGDRYLRDVTYLRAGEMWSERLEEMILKADIFQLFWSTNSMHSPFVKQEWEYALSLQRPNFIRPTYWEEPLPAEPERKLPPEDLMRLHFQRIYGGADAQRPRSATLVHLPPEVSSTMVSPGGGRAVERGEEMLPRGSAQSVDQPLNAPTVGSGALVRPETERVVCRRCGSQFGAGIRFCGTCGGSTFDPVVVISAVDEMAPPASGVFMPAPNYAAPRVRSERKKVPIIGALAILFFAALIAPVWFMMNMASPGSKSSNTPRAGNTNTSVSRPVPIEPKLVTAPADLEKYLQNDPTYREPIEVREVDLNGDGKAELFAQYQPCGSGGCTIHLFRRARSGGFEDISGSLVEQQIFPPLEDDARGSFSAGPTSTNGYLDLRYRFQNGLTLNFSFDGRKYRKL